MQAVKVPLKSIWTTLPLPVRGLIRTMRPTQWAKNGFVFAGIIFDKKLLQAEPLARVVVTFGLLCLVASTIYIVNDLVDIERDRLHPRKRNRALPSGELPISWALVAATVMPLVALAAGLALSPALAAVLLAYLTLHLAYSFWLKNVVIIDVFTIAAGFVLRLVAGIVVIDVTNFSPWLYVCAGLLALFLAIGKRRQELILLADNAENHRSAYKDYNMSLLDDMLRMVTTGSVLTYML
ncbi:MAG TPA: UbiA family prenyltransferase, partial [Aggregatilineaceae bacterium]|nr:UbiA family prenyltransferase [Aggregatilineaceae bacterium]